ncbi:hypothetical protein FLL45_12670 [Aliikangiella marina]|uniref:Uncharacterized protein n=1 Tax=Aliikangiella marina TaxID=1712262 RepID=A0A545T916_9GAMM|nr:hypothetical protein [Aliikangiella marina]TQV73717.1 hypothetical protein FLL45_12670 [Aliikangiella marina]
MREIEARLVSGYQIASGLADDSPYPSGSIELQIPYFKQLGLDLSDYYAATLNLDISPYAFEIREPDYFFPQVKWYQGVSENFLFVECRLIHLKKAHSGHIYYPDPKTKPAHLHSRSLIEVIAPFIPGIQVHDKMVVEVDESKLSISIA